MRWIVAAVLCCVLLSVRVTGVAAAQHITVEFVFQAANTQHGQTSQQVTFLGSNPPARGLVRVQTGLAQGTRLTSTTAQCTMTSWKQRGRAHFALAGTGTLYITVSENGAMKSSTPILTRSCSMTLDEQTNGSWKVSVHVGTLSVSGVMEHGRVKIL